jgi:hypothetical protein
VLQSICWRFERIHQEPQIPRADSRQGALNPLLDQLCRKQTINIQELS